MERDVLQQHAERRSTITVQLPSEWFSGSFLDVVQQVELKHNNLNPDVQLVFLVIYKLDRFWNIQQNIPQEMKENVFKVQHFK